MPKDGLELVNLQPNDSTIAPFKSPYATRNDSKDVEFEGGSRFKTNKKEKTEFVAKRGPFLNESNNYWNFN